MHIIAAKAACFGEALKPEFKDYAAQVVKNAKAMAAKWQNSASASSPTVRTTTSSW